MTTSIRRRLTQVTVGAEDRALAIRLATHAVMVALEAIQVVTLQIVAKLAAQAAATGATRYAIDKFGYKACLALMISPQIP